MKKGFVSGLDLHNRNLKRWLWIASHALQLSAKDITLWEPLPWVHLVLLGALISGNLSRKHIRSRLQMRTWIHGQWGNFEKAKCRLTTWTALESQNKPVLKKEANIPSRGACLGPERRATVPLLLFPRHTHVSCLHCPAKYLSIFSFHMTMPVWEIPCVCMSTWK